MTRPHRLGEQPCGSEIGCLAAAPILWRHCASPPQPVVVCLGAPCVDYELRPYRPFAGPMDEGEDYMPALLGYGVAAPTPNWCGELAGGATLDARPRIDSGVAAVGVGEVALCGGVGSHPNAAYSPAEGHGFYRTAVLYDSLFDAWVGLPPLRCRRHGAAAAAVGRSLFVLGGQYVDAEVPVAVRGGKPWP